MKKATPMCGENRLRVGVFFGGRSVEHEISVITALQLMLAMDPARYTIIPVYVAPDGRWFTGKPLRERAFYRSVPNNLSELEEVTLLPKPGVGGLTILTPVESQQETAETKSIIKIDVALPVFHGQFGEDGCMQGLFELAGTPYSGSDLTSSAITMNKYLCKSILKEHGLPVLPGLLVSKKEAQNGLNGVINTILSTPYLSDFPIFVKPCNLGSSIGISRVSSRDDLQGALTKVFRFDETAIVEPCVTDIMEVNVSIRDNCGTPEVSVVEIPVSETGVLSYEEKYLRDGGGKKGGASQGMASLTRVIDPKDLDPQIRDAVVSLGKHAFTILGCSGVARMDFIVDLKDGAVYCNELNALPGSCAFYLWARSHPRVLYTDLIDTMIDTALDRFSRRFTLERTIGLRALRR